MLYPDELHPVYWRNEDGKRWIRRGDVIDYFDETFNSAVYQWQRWKMFGLPHGGGPMSERPIVVQAIQIVEEEKNLYESRKSEERHGGSRGTKGHRTG